MVGEGIAVRALAIEALLGQGRGVCRAGARPLRSIVACFNGGWEMEEVDDDEGSKTLVLQLCQADVQRRVVLLLLISRGGLPGADRMVCALMAVVGRHVSRPALFRQYLQHSSNTQCNTQSNQTCASSGGGCCCSAICACLLAWMAVAARILCGGAPLSRVWLHTVFEKGCMPSASVCQALRSPVVVDSSTPEQHPCLQPAQIIIHFSSSIANKLGYVVSALLSAASQTKHSSKEARRRRQPRRRGAS